MENRILILNVPVDNVSFQQALEIIEGAIQEGRRMKVFTPNLDHLRLCKSDQEFLSLYCRVDLSLADGMPLIWSSRWHRHPLKEKVSGSDLFPALCAVANDNGHRVFLLGGEPGVPEAAVQQLRLKWPNLNVAGYYSPPLGFENDPEQLAYITKIIRQAGPHLLFVALGSPKQEKWISANIENLPPCVAIGIGASLDFAAGKVKRAPIWAQKHGFEWLFRLMTEPRRLWRRYLVHDLPLAWQLFIHSPKADQ